MNLESINMIDIALAGVSAVLLAVCILLLVRLVKRKKQCAMLQMELDRQKSRVIARKEKIWELREKMHELLLHLSEDERKLLNSYTQEEIAALYPEIIEAFRGLLKAIEINKLPQIKQADVMSEAIKLSHLLKNAFRMTEEPLLVDAEIERAEEAGDESIAPRRVLIVDDNEESRHRSAEIVEGSGYWVDMAANGEEAVEKIRISREGYYDLILMDIIMQGKNGYDACRDIRKLLRADCERIPIIALTANNFAEDYVRLIDAGMNDRIAKPISRNAFLNVADKWLNPHENKMNAAADADTWFSLSSAGESPRPVD